MPRILPPGWDIPIKEEPQNESLDPEVATEDDEEEEGRSVKRIKTEGFNDDDEVQASSPPSKTNQPKRMVEAFMIPGVENDDKYCMVEDELYEIAKKFTAHLHAAEYRRLQAETSDLSEEAIRNIARPVTGVRSTVQETGHTRTDRMNNLRRAVSGDSHKYQESSLYALMHSSAAEMMPPLNLMAEGRTGKRSQGLNQPVAIPGSSQPETLKRKPQTQPSPRRQSPPRIRPESMMPISATERRTTSHKSLQHPELDETRLQEETGEETADATTGDETETADEDSEIDLGAIPRPAKHILRSSSTVLADSAAVFSSNPSSLCLEYPRPELKSPSQTFSSSYPAEHTGDSGDDSDFSDDIFTSMRRKRMAKTLHHKTASQNAPKSQEEPKAREKSVNVMPTFL